MRQSEVFNLRIDGELRERLRQLAQRGARTESDIVRRLILQADPERVTTGIPAPTLLEAEASERELSVA